MIYNKEKKILIISNHRFTTSGGYEKVLIRFINEINRHGYKVDIVSLQRYPSRDSKSVLREFDDFNIKFKHISSSKINYILQIIIKSLFGRLLILGQEQINLILKENNCKLVVVTDPLYLSACKLALKENQHLVYWDHGSIIYYLVSSIKKKIYFKDIKRGMASVSLFLSISEGLSKFASKYIDKGKIATVLNPMDDLIDYRIRKKFEAGRFAYIGRIDDYQKNLTFLLKALSLYKNKWFLHIIGDGADAIKIKKLAKKLNIDDKIHWHGYVQEPYKIIDEMGCQLILSTSRYEGLPLSLIEAIQRGYPFVSSDCFSGPSDICLEGINGFLYKEGNLDDFIKKLKRATEVFNEYYDYELVASSAKKFENKEVMSKIIKEIKNLVGDANE